MPIVFSLIDCVELKSYPKNFTFYFTFYLLGYPGFVPQVNLLGINYFAIETSKVEIFKVETSTRKKIRVPDGIHAPLSSRML